MRSPRRRLFVSLAAFAAGGAAAVVLSGSAAATARPQAAPAVGYRAAAQAVPGAVAAPAAGQQRANPLNPFDDCINSPIPELPGRGVVGFFDIQQDPLPVEDDPFQKSSKTTIMEQYGYAGLRFNTYDPSCSMDIVPDVVQSPDAAVGTSISNWIMSFPKTALAMTGALLADAYRPDFLSVFDPLISDVVHTLRVSVYDQWAMLMVAAIGLMIIWRARKVPLASGAAAIGWAMFVMMIASVLFRWPVEAGHVADSTVKSTLSAVTGGLNGVEPDGRSPVAVQASSNLHESLLYTTWLGGTFGDSRSEVAQKYGPAIFDAQALTWRETEILRKNHSEGKKIIEAKRKKFKETASKIKSEDPDAYEYLIGHRSDSRVGYSVLASIATLCAIPFLVVSCLLVLGALVIVRFGVMLFPLFATLGLFPPMRSVVIGIGNTVAAAVINALIFGIGSAVTVKAMGVVLAPDNGLADWLDIILLLLLTIVMWMALSPFRRLTTMVSPRRDHFGISNLDRVHRGALLLARARGEAEPGAAKISGPQPVGAEGGVLVPERQLMGGAARAEAAPLDWSVGRSSVPFAGARPRGAPALAPGPTAPGPGRPALPALPSAAVAGGAGPSHDQGNLPAPVHVPGAPNVPGSPGSPGDPDRLESLSRAGAEHVSRAGAEHVAGRSATSGGQSPSGASGQSYSPRQSRQTSAPTGGEVGRTESSPVRQPGWVGPSTTNDEGFVVLEPQEIEGEQVWVYRPPNEATDPPMIDLTNPAHTGEVRDVEAAGIGSDATFHVPERN
ncbi:MAG: hypothetical protein QG608_3103 [Actinomycetota bacterium]|nr:hypothetical protein [Actinomycetota bacterium]